MSGSVRVDYTGKVVGMLTVVGLDRSVRYKSGAIHHYWKCRCKCGNSTVVFGSNLSKTTHTRSCGCLPKQTAEGVLGRVLSLYRSSANQRGIAFELTREQALELFQSCCYYCGTEHSNTARTYHTTEGLRVPYNGIDRVDNTKGYVEGNVVTCCSPCNMAKREMTAQEYVELCRRVAAHRGV